jgi:hypothetical protein
MRKSRDQKKPMPNPDAPSTAREPDPQGVRNRLEIIRFASANA